MRLTEPLRLIECFMQKTSKILFKKTSVRIIVHGWQKSWTDFQNLKQKSCRKRLRILFQAKFADRVFDARE